MIILQTIFFGILFVVGFAIVGHIFGFLGDAVFNKAEKEAKKRKRRMLKYPANNNCCLFRYSMHNAT